MIDRTQNHLFSGQVSRRAGGLNPDTFTRTSVPDPKVFKIFSSPGADVHSGFLLLVSRGNQPETSVNQDENLVGVGLA